MNQRSRIAQQTWMWQKSLVNFECRCRDRLRFRAQDWTSKPGLFLAWFRLWSVFVLGAVHGTGLASPSWVATRLSLNSAYPQSFVTFPVRVLCNLLPVVRRSRNTEARHWFKTIRKWTGQLLNNGTGQKEFRSWTVARKWLISSLPVVRR